MAGAHLCSRHDCTFRLDRIVFPVRFFDRERIRAFRRTLSGLVKRIDALPQNKRKGEETAMSEFLSANLPHLLSGISVGGQYALIAIGYTMVYGILRLINFAHGDVFMVAGLVMVYATASLPIYVSIILVIVVTVALGVIIEKVAYKPLRSAPRMSVMISAIGVSYLLQNCALYFTGGLPQVYPDISFLTKLVHIGPATTKMVTVITPILTLVLVVLLVLLIKRTKVGMAMRAVSKDFETSELMGIKINNVISMTFVIGCALAAVGSVRYTRRSLAR